MWAVLKPGFLALLEDPFDTRLLDIVVFDILPTSNGNGGSQVYLSNQIKERNPLCYAFKVRFFVFLFCLNCIILNIIFSS